MSTETAAETATEAATEAVAVTPAAIAAFQSFYLAELDSRVQRSEVVGAITLKKGSAALFYEPVEGKFTLVEKMPDVEAANVFDCIPREQWGRMVMLLGHATNTGGYIASGHAILDGNTIKVKLASGHYYRMDVDATLAHLQPFVGEPSKPGQEGRQQTPGNRREPREPREPRGPAEAREPRPPGRSTKVKGRQFGKQSPQGDEGTQQVSNHSAPNDECEDLTEEDLRRLRGEMPLTGKSKRKWQH